MRKRKRSKYTWMPTLGGVATDGDSSYGTTHFGYVQPIANSSVVFNSHVVSLVPDETFFPDQGQPANTVSLRDFTEGQDWFLKRIVGKCSVGVRQTSPAVSTDITWPNVLVGAAFFVAKAEDDNQEQPDLEVQEYDPLGSQNVRQPWIWRRTWILSDFGTTYSAFDGGPSQYHVYPSSNTLNTGSGQMDGPHIDAKTARRIRREERLWFVTTMTPFKQTTDQGGNVSNSNMMVAVNLDYRILGQLRKSQNRSTFG